MIIWYVPRGHTTEKSTPHTIVENISSMARRGDHTKRGKLRLWIVKYKIWGHLQLYPNFSWGVVSGAINNAVRGRATWFQRLYL